MLRGGGGRHKRNNTLISAPTYFASLISTAPSSEYFSVWAPAWAVVGSLILAASLLVVNVAANLLSPMNDLLNLSPERFNFKW